MVSSPSLSTILMQKGSKSPENLELMQINLSCFDFKHSNCTVHRHVEKIKILLVSGIRKIFRIIVFLLDCEGQTILVTWLNWSCPTTGTVKGLFNFRFGLFLPGKNKSSFQVLFFLHFMQMVHLKEVKSQFHKLLCSSVSQLVLSLFVCKHRHQHWWISNI